MGVGDTFTICAAKYEIISKPTTSEGMKILGMIARCTKRTSLDAIVGMSDAVVSALQSLDPASLGEEGAARQVINATLEAAINGLHRSAADFMDVVGAEELPALVEALLAHASRNNRTLRAGDYEMAFSDPLEPLRAAREVAMRLGFFGPSGGSAVPNNGAA